MIAVTLAVAASAATSATVSGNAALDGCLANDACGDPALQRAAAALSDAGLATEALATGLSASMVRGTGVVAELSLQSLTVPDGEAPSGVDLVPAVPWLGVGAVLERGVRLGFGAYGGVAAPLDGVDLGFSGGVRAGVAVGSPDGSRWFGFEVDGGFAEVQGTFFDDRDRAFGDLGGEGNSPPCPNPCTDRVGVLRGGVDAVMSVDPDAVSGLLIRFGAAGTSSSLDVAADGSSWSWFGIEPRATLGAAYRPDPRAVVSAGVRVSVHATPTAIQRSPFGLVAAIGAGWRFGPSAAPQPVVEAVVAKPVEVVSVAPRVDVRRHPELTCGEGTLPTGAPPPLGLEGWCVTITPSNQVLREGPYVRWHDEQHVAERGRFEADLAVGHWQQYDLAGAVVSEGDFREGHKEGPWQTWYSTGTEASSGSYVRGREVGTWTYFGEDGRSRVVGTWNNGSREGKWIDYGPDGVARRERVFREGRLMSEVWRNP